MFNLFNIVDWIAGGEPERVRLEAKRCLYSRYRFSDCETCFTVCPTNAITPGKPPSLNPAACQTCRACVAVCPVGAYTGDDAAGPLLNRAAQLGAGTLELVCQKNSRAARRVSETSTGIRVQGCLAGLGAGAYLALVAAGREHVVVRLDGCADCEWGRLGSQVYAQVSQAKRILAVWKKEAALESITKLEAPAARPVTDATRRPMSRRDRLLMPAYQVRSASGQPVEAGQGAASQRAVRDRQRMVRAISQLSAPGVEGAGMGEAGLACLEVSDACSACGVCARACPTGALKISQTENATNFTLTLAATECIGCEICAHVCADSAIRVNHAPTYAQVFGEPETTLQAGRLVKCERCGVLMAARPGAHLCPLCARQRTPAITRTGKPGYGAAPARVREGETT